MIMRELVKVMYPENEFDEQEEELLNALNSLPLENQYQNALQWKVITKKEPTLTEGKKSLLLLENHFQKFLSYSSLVLSCEVIKNNAFVVRIPFHQRSCLTERHIIDDEQASEHPLAR